MTVSELVIFIVARILRVCVGVSCGAAIPAWTVDPGHISGLAVQTQCHYVSVLAVLMVSSWACCQAVGCQTSGGVEVSVLSRNTLSGQSVNHQVSLLSVIVGSMVHC